MKIGDTKVLDGKKYLAVEEIKIGKCTGCCGEFLEEMSELCDDCNNYTDFIFKVKEKKKNKYKYLEVEEYKGQDVLDLTDKLVEEFSEVLKEIRKYSDGNNKLDFISELHDLAQISNTIIYKVCDEQGIKYSDTMKTHKEKILSRLNKK